MKTNTYIYMLALGALAFSACSKEEFKEAQTSLHRVILSGDCSTRVSYAGVEDGKLPVIWTAGDLIGLWADEDGAALSGAQNKAARVLDYDESGPGFKSGSFYTDLPISAGKSYTLSIYYPFLSEAGSKAAIAHRVPDCQRQLSANDSRHLGISGTFAYAEATFDTPETMESGYTPEVNFSLSHKTATVWLVVKAGDTGLSGWKVRKVRFIAPDGCKLAGDAVYSPSADEFTYSDGASAITVEIAGGAVLATDEAADIYMVSYPASLAGKTVNIEYHLENAGATAQKVIRHARQFGASSQSLSAGNTTRLVENIPSSPAGEWSDVSAAVTDLSANGTSNCYIAYVPGSYSFDATVIGNGQRGIMLPLSTTRFHTDNPTISPSSAVLLWQTAKNLITDVSYASGRITFTKGSGKGNAVIAAKDASGNIIWSWHIWCTQPGTDRHIVTEWGSYEGMDRNLGALASFNVIPSSTADRASTLGLYYQWGRKDPFVGPSTLANYGGNYAAADAVIYDAAGNALTYTNPNDSSHPLPRKSAAASAAKNTGSVVYSIRNPQTFLYGGGATTYDWCGYPTGGSTPSIANKTHWFWGNPEGYNYKDKSIPTPVKTIYDPCPPGYMVPPADVHSSIERMTSSAYIGNVFYTDGTMTTSSFYPCCSCIQGNYSKGAAKMALFIGDGYVYMWSSTYMGATNNNAYMLSAGATTSNSFSTALVKANGLGVRCVQEIVK